MHYAFPFFACSESEALADNYYAFPPGAWGADAGFPANTILIRDAVQQEMENHGTEIGGERHVRVMVNYLKKWTDQLDGNLLNY